MITVGPLRRSSVSTNVTRVALGGPGRLGDRRRRSRAWPTASRVASPPASGAGSSAGTVTVFVSPPPPHPITSTPSAPATAPAIRRFIPPPYPSARAPNTADTSGERAARLLPAPT